MEFTPLVVLAATALLVVLTGRTDARRISERANEATGKPNEKVCKLKVLADHTFYQIFASQNQTMVDEEIVFHINKMNATFRATDFDGDGQPDNIGFRVVKQQTVTRENEPGYLLAANYTNADDYLAQISTYSDVSNYCMTLVFSFRKFQGRVPENSVFGAAYKAEPLPNDQAGICGNPYNVMFVSLSDKEGKRVVPSDSTSYTMAHEMGHAFGALHDEEERAEHPECAPSEDEDKFLMTDTFVVGDDLYPHNWLFSECSKRRIRDVLKMRNGCLVTTCTTY